MANDVAIMMLVKAVNVEAAKLAEKPVSYRRYMQLSSEEIVPKPQKGKVDAILALIRWLLYYRKLAEAAGSVSLMDERTALTAIKRQREHLRLEEEKGNLIVKEDAEKTYGEFISNLRLAILAQPKRMAPVLTPLTDTREIELALRKDNVEMLGQLSKPIHGKRKRRS